jgi:hypothetical protein
MTISALIIRPVAAQRRQLVSTILKLLDNSIRSVAAPALIITLRLNRAHFEKEGFYLFSPFYLNCLPYLLTLRFLFT